MNGYAVLSPAAVSHTVPMLSGAARLFWGNWPCLLYTSGYSLSEEGRQTVEDNLQELKDTCKENGYSVAYYLNATYGEYMNYATYEKVITDNQLAQEYETKMKESFEQSDKDVDAYYKEHSAELDTFTYQAYLVPVSTEAGTDAEGNTEEPRCV